MNLDATTKGRAGRALAAMVALAGTATLIAAPASAATGQGSAAIVLAKHDKGRTLSGQGVQVIAGVPATKDGNTLSLPITNVDPGANASATTDGWLRFKRGRRSVSLTGLRFNLSAGTLSGKLGKEQIDAFKLGAAANVDSVAGTVSLQDAGLRLTPAAATALKKKLSLERALRHNGVGMAWLAAKANPTHAAAQAVASGSTDWGVLASWRAYVLGQQGPPHIVGNTVGTITAAGGATANGDLTAADGFVAFPATGGTYEKGLYGAADKLTLSTQGSIVFAKPAHCIIEVSLANLRVKLDGAASTITLDSGYDIDVPSGPSSCTDVPPVAANDVTFAALDLSDVTPVVSGDGKAVTWANVPATLTEAGSIAFMGGEYAAGQPLDPVTITVGIG